MPKSKYPKTLSEWLRNQGVKLKLSETLQVEDKVIPIFIVNPTSYPGHIFPFGGKLIKKTIAATAGDATKNLSPETGKRWLFMYGRVKISTDSTVANRYALIQITDGTNVVCQFPYSLVIDASKSRYISINQNLMAYDSAAYTISESAGHLSIGQIILEDSQQFRISITNGVAGDSFQGYIYFLEINK